MQAGRMVGVVLAALSVFSLPLFAQKSGPAFPRDGAKNVLDNDTVAIWDVTWPKGKSTGLREHRYDQMTVTLAEGAVRTTRSDNTWTVEHSKVGAMQFESKGTVVAEEGVSDRAKSNRPTVRLKPDTTSALGRTPLVCTNLVRTTLGRMLRPSCARHSDPPTWYVLPLVRSVRL